MSSLPVFLKLLKIELFYIYLPYYPFGKHCQFIFLTNAQDILPHAFLVIIFYLYNLLNTIFIAVLIITMKVCFVFKALGVLAGPG